MQYPSVISYPADMPYPGHFRLLTCSITSITFVFSLTQTFVGWVCGGCVGGGVFVIV